MAYVDDVIDHLLYQHKIGKIDNSHFEMVNSEHFYDLIERIYTIVDDDVAEDIHRGGAEEGYDIGYKDGHRDGYKEGSKYAEERYQEGYNEAVDEYKHRF